MTKRLHLALQGGGAHGAFTWGAIDRLLEEDVEIEGISGTSAGAMNAAAFKCGWLSGGADGARAKLDSFWRTVAYEGSMLPPMVETWLRAVSPSPALMSSLLELSPNYIAGDLTTRFFSPYELNPTNHNPLRKLVADMMTDNVQADCAPHLFINATNVRTGKVKVFKDQEVTVDAVLASTCLPTMYQAVEIEDPATGRTEAYWDGGYTGNPALFPLFELTADDILIIHINPIYRDDIPRSATDISNRINEISFNTSLLRELRAINFVKRLIESGRIPAGAMKNLHIHSVIDDETMQRLGVATKLTPALALLLSLRDAGRAAMDRFIQTSWDNVGTRSSVELRAMFQ